MKGSVLDFDEGNRSGIISGEDGNRYTLDISEWKGNQLPKAGAKVDFAVTGDKAEAVYPDSAASNTSTSSKKIAAAVLAFFLGAFGAHKFYLGYTKEGVIMLLVFLFGFILLGIPSFIIGIIAFIEFIIYIVKPDDEFEETYVQGHRPWF